jgi:hypothetical protein
MGQVFKLKRLDPKYVCSRCQGMEADERIVTFCPTCADLQRDVVLRLCGKCGFDFRTVAGKTPLWAERVAEPDPEPVVAAAAAAAVEPATAAVAVEPAAESMPAHTYEPATTAWPTPVSVPMGTAPVGRSGKRCQMCRRDFATLWRVVIGTPAGFEERFLCGTNLTYQMQSIVPAVRV